MSAGKKLTLEVEPEETIENIKRKVQDLEGILPDRQTIVWDGRMLQNWETLVGCQIEKESTLHLVGRLRGAL